MSPLLLLVLTYLAVHGEASPTARRLYFGHNQNEFGLETGALSKPLTFRRYGHHRSARFVFPGSGPAPPSPRSASRIFFPGETPPAPAVGHDVRGPSDDGGDQDHGDASSSKITNVGAVWFPRVTRDVMPAGDANDCGVKPDLTYTYEGSTWELLSRGRCPVGEWVVMVAKCQPECRPVPCPSGQLEHQGRCVNLTDPTVCGGGQVLYVDQTGSTFCDCENDHFFYPWDGQCYARQGKGPCDFGFYLDLNENGSVECMPNYCQVDDFVKNPTTGKCVRKGYVGYCPEDRLQFHENNTIVDCFLLDIRTIFTRAVTSSCTSGSGLSHLGGCRSEFVVPSVTALPRSLTAGCYAGTLSVTGGACRRINNYVY
ncbi:uncharacterized protein LOC126998093 [Eriocheir sinensis]|uniref:uncharacterized protein LOC126998093 n=1 Tax=Eriocheir sinensis TaxID=95602 RepID=UPI0021C9C86F|nr:uncharacterized protein LOC126998093 [Eriocheir sinensis]